MRRKEYPASSIEMTQVNTIMAEVDVDHNGKMDLSEFILMMHKQVNFF